MEAGYGNQQAAISPTIQGPASGLNYASQTNTVKNPAYYEALAPRLNANGVTPTWSSNGITDYNSFSTSANALAGKLYESNVRSAPHSLVGGAGAQIYKAGATNADLANYQSAMQYGINKGYINREAGSGFDLAGTIIEGVAMAGLGYGAGAAIGTVGGAGAGAAASDSAAASDAGMLSTGGSTGVSTGAGTAGGAGGSESMGGSGSNPSAQASPNSGYGGGNMSGAAPGATTSPSLLSAIGSHVKTAMEIGSLLGTAAQLAKGHGSGVGDIPTPPAPAPLPQGEVAPDAGSISKNLTGAMGPGGSLSGNANTFLTGTGGVDPNSLKLGKATLLGA